MTVYSTPRFGDISIALLREEINAAITPAVCGGLCFGGTVVHIEPDIDLNTAQQASFQLTVENHDNEPLPTLKANLIKLATEYYEIDRDTGFLHNGHTFSGNISSISHLSVGKHMKASEVYPVTAPTAAGVSYSIANEADFDGIFNAMKAHARSCLENFADASNSIAIAADKSAAQAAYDAYAV